MFNFIHRKKKTHYPNYPSYNRELISSISELDNLKRSAITAYDAKKKKQDSEERAALQPETDATIVLFEQLFGVKPSDAKGRYAYVGNPWNSKTFYRSAIVSDPHACFRVVYAKCDACNAEIYSDAIGSLEDLGEIISQSKNVTHTCAQGGERILKCRLFTE